MSEDFYKKLKEHMLQDSEDIKAITTEEEGYFEFCMEWAN